MKNRFRAALLIAVLTLALLAGCTAQALGNPTTVQTDPIAPVVPDAPAEPGTAAGENQTPPAGEVPTLTAEEARAIALTHAGFTEEQVRFLRVEPELRDRVPHFDVEFEKGRWEYEYEIHAETGAILSFEKDD